MIMKNKLIFVMTMLMVANVVMVLPQENTLVESLLVNCEALADDEYHQGQFGTNWKTYTITCTITDTQTYSVGGSVGIKKIVGDVNASYTSSHQSSYTMQKDVCGSGGGACLSPASNHPC